MTEAATATKKPDQRHDGVDTDKGDVDRSRGDTSVEAPEEQAERPDNEVMRPVWVEPHRIRAHRPFFVERSTRGMIFLPRSRAGIETVVVTRGCAPAVLGNRGAPSRWSMFWQDGTLYEIDLGLHHTAFEGGQAGDRVAPDLARVAGVERRTLLVAQTGGSGEAQRVAVEQVHAGEPGVAQREDAAHDRLEHRLHVALRLTYYAQNLARRYLLLQSFS